MQATFNDLVNNVRNLSLTEKLEIKDIVEKSIIDEQRKKIYDSYLESKQEHKEDTLTFSNNIKTLKNIMDE